MKYAALFLWLLVPLGFWLGITLYGTPHIALNYTFYDNGRPYDPTARRVYFSCDYLGWHGWHTVPASGGKCRWVRFFVEGADQ